MSHAESPFAALDPPLSRKAVRLAKYNTRDPHAPDPGLWSREAPNCPECGSRCKPYAFLDSDGWILSWDCCDDAVEEIPWLFGSLAAGPKDLSPLGFVIV